MNGVNDGFNSSIKPNPSASFIKEWDVFEQNFVINGYSGVWSYDRDDGSQFVQDRSSFLIFGGCKNYLGNRKFCGARYDIPSSPGNQGNVILYPGTNGRSQGNRRCQTDDNGEFSEQYHLGNTCANSDGDFYSFSGCQLNENNLNTTVYRTGNNTLLADSGTTFDTVCGANTNFQQWQSLDQDISSTLSVTPSVPQLMALGAKVLGIN